MNKKYTNVIWGLCLVALGIIMLGNYTGLFSVELFFNGCWTLFIIIPAIMGLFSKCNRVSSLIFLVIGILLLLDQQDIITSDMLWKLMIPAVAIIVGISIIISAFGRTKIDDILQNGKQSKSQVYTAIFNGSDRKYSNEEFNGAYLKSIFGGVDLDIRDAIINQDIVINAVAIFGGCTILAPKNVNVKTTGTSIFGGTDNRIV